MYLTNLDVQFYFILLWLEKMNGQSYIYYDIGKI